MGAVVRVSMYPRIDLRMCSRDNSTGTALKEPPRLNGSGSPLSITQAKASTARDFMAPAIRTLFETTYLAGLRKAGVPEE